MSLPKYTDSEVRCFHPVVQDALIIAIQNLGLQDYYEVEHEVRFGTTPADFALKSKHSGKYHLVIEVKRTISDVVSTRYRYQAKSYIDEAGSQMEKKYYAITNLEQTDLFLASNDEARSSVLLQMLEGGPYEAGNLKNVTTATEETLFKANLIQNFENIISLVKSNFSTYASMSSKLYDLLSSTCTSAEEWHKSLMLCGYEWMRGVLSSYRCLPPQLKNALSYKGTPRRLAERGKLIDFNLLFSEPYPDTTNQHYWDNGLLEEMHRLGKTRSSGDELAIFAHEILFADRYHDGVVMTDLELSKLLAAVAKRIHHEELQQEHIICDPAAGAGTLLTNIQNSFPTIQPNQIWANEKEDLLQEPLSIRIGLAYVPVLSPQNAPIITIENILNLERSHFENVKIILVNPPYLRRVDSMDLCINFANRIEEISGEQAMTYSGQNGLEALFIELIYELVSNGTTICCILPKQYLQLRGNGGQSFREFLLNKFKVKLIANYPMEGLFDKVTKATAIYATKKDNVPNLSVESLDIEIPLSKLDNISDFEGYNSSPYGVSHNYINTELLEENIRNGWASYFNSSEEFNEVLSNWMMVSSISFDLLGNSSIFQTHSTTMGRHGGIKLLFPFSNRDIHESLQSLIPQHWLAYGINKAKSNMPYRTRHNSEYFLSPPNNAFITGTDDNILLITIIEKYNEIMTRQNSGRQRVNSKTTDDLIALLASEKGMISNHPIVLPRNIRRNGQVYYFDLDGYISSNFIEIHGSELNKKVLASWLLSSFAQLNFEIVGVNREGTRKIEEINLQDIYIPNIEELSVSEKERIALHFESLTQEEAFIDLYCPFDNGTTVDNLWYEILWGESKENAKDDIIGYLSDIVQIRTPNASC